MVPFYGQGLNCGLEDVRVLSALFDAAGMRGDNHSQSSEEDGVEEGMHEVLKAYSETRHEDLVAICDLAMDN
jgi:kynurenine 3-monooxygenase